MLLVAALAEHRGPLRASLRAEYQIDLSRPGMPWTELADLVAGLTPGCALWRAMGGPMAWSQETQTLVAILDVLRILEWENGGIVQRKPRGSPPKPTPPPPLANEQAAKEARSRAKRDRYLRRQALRTHGPPDA
ncbi:hypothetical protein SAMN04487781_3229 [Cellulosimicrobium cellulans]|nr:hypothetical protein SAMN04487781_3229 [Cellulosimicrobium cellulans]